ncbi:MAG: nascent polypeptide-associated complex protein [Nitrososphaerota archaeon]|nr:nascent polypeptide-associated complex protein [Nitrososphaerota archaeon]
MAMRFGSRREQERLLKRLGIKIEEIQGVKSVVIETEKERIVFNHPIVTKMIGGPQEIYQVIGEPILEERGEEYVPSEDDVLLVAKQTGKGVEEARKALVATGGDIAQAIVLLQSGSL